MTSNKSLTSSAMVDLKAELHRKQEEFRRQKVDHGQNVKGRKVKKIKTKKNIWNLQNRGVSERASRDVEEMVEEEDDLVRSRRMLAHKTRLYDEMTSTSIVPDEDGSEGFLVDFQKKAVDRIVEERENQRKEEEEREDEAEKKALAEPISEPVDSDEEWVEFTDSLGRSRCCMKRDLANMKQKDRDLSREVKSKEKEDSDSNKGTTDPELPDLMSRDMYREKMRQKWEEEENARLDKGQEEIHYSNVQFDEIRSHGVGYYQFSKDHEAREEQLKQLKKMREETEIETSRKDKVQAKRKAMMEARLAKVRDRRKLKDAVSSDNKTEEAMDKIDAVATAKNVKEEEERESTEVRKNHIREWDKEKQKNSWAGKGYVETRRNEREAEFAPPSVYFDKKPKPKSSGMSNEMRANRLKESVQGRGVKMDFAPPSCYFNQDKTISSKKQEKSDMSNTNASLISKSLHESKNSLIPQSSDPIDNDTVCLESIPLPSGNVDVGKKDSHNRSESSSSVEVSSNQPQVLGNEWQYNHQQQLQQQQLQLQQQLQQQLQPPPHYLQLQYDNYHQPQQMTHDAWMSYQQQQHPHQHDHYQQQQEYPLNQPTQTVPKPTQIPPQPLQKTERLPQKRLQHQATTTSTKSKVPKSAIMDTRFMLNDLPTTKPDSTSFSTSKNISSPSPVEAVPYQPGSFTAARFPQDVTPEESNQGPEPTTAQITGGPQLYSKQQLEEQHKQLEEGNEPDPDQKLNDFLASIRAETK